jgi:penicillin-binding protein 2
VHEGSSRFPVLILDQLDIHKIAVVEEYKHKLPCIFIDIGRTRYYPWEQATAHLLGYIGPPKESDIKAIPLVPSRSLDFKVGKSGIEKYYQDKLSGHYGYKEMEVNAFGKYVRELNKLNAEDGVDLSLNIDVKLQSRIVEYLNPLGSSVIAMNCNSGEILIFAVSPTFEPNSFSRLSKDYWQSLLRDPYRPLINKAVQNCYPAGSVFKPITAIAALEHGMDPYDTVNCDGVPALGSKFRCWHKTGHGRLNMIDALKCSCNCYMYHIAKTVGAQKIIDTAKKFGFGAKTGIDMPGEVAGFVPTINWKKNKLKSDWSLGDTLNLAIGQGFLLVTPIQLAVFASAIANDGRIYVPQVAKNNPYFRESGVDVGNISIIKEGMYRAVNVPGGTAYASKLSGEFGMSGKTGTAQVAAKTSINDDLSHRSIAWERKNHAAFIGFAPYDIPKYAIEVLVDHGGGGGRVAAPIARRVMEEILNSSHI